MSQDVLTAAKTERELTPYKAITQALEARRGHFRQLLGSDDAASRFIRVALMAIQQNPALLGVDQRSLLIACMKAAGDGLMPDGREAVFNIYKTRAQYLPMVGGLVRKLWESGLYTMIDACAVFERDHFRYQRGDAPMIEHIPYDGHDDPGSVRAAYFIARLKNGDVKREVMWRRDIEKVRAKSQAGQGLMWGDFYDQAAIKSVIKRAFKQLPSTPALEQLMQNDNEALDTLPIESESPQPPPETEGVSDPPIASAKGGRLRPRLEELRRSREPETRSRAVAGDSIASKAASLPSGELQGQSPATKPAAELWEPTDEEKATILERELAEARREAEREPGADERR